MFGKIRISGLSFVALVLSACGADAPVQFGLDSSPLDAADTGNDSTLPDSIDLGESDADAETDDLDAADVPDTAEVVDAADAADGADTVDVEPDAPVAVCGDGVVGIGEVCDQLNLNGQSCGTRGFASGELACRADCLAFDTSACVGECVADCTGRECGLEPICGESCGACADGESCGATGICSPTIEPAECGNGVSESGELCDEADVGTANCTDFGFDRGTLTCNSDCRSFSFAACETDVEPTPVCGNGLREPGELCDGADVGLSSCVSFGYDRGSLGCNADCAGFNFTGCADDPVGPTCGNGAVEAGEACDPPDFGDQTCISLGYDRGALACASDCRSVVTTGCESTCDPVCGARVCGNDPVCGISCGVCAEGQVCSAAGSCTTPGPVCGNANVEAGEVCDPPDFNMQTCISLGYDRGALACAPDCRTLNTSGCVADCTPACGVRVCGNDPVCGVSCGTCDAGETCNSAGSCVSECVPNCSGRDCGLEPTCGTSCGTCGVGFSCNLSGNCEAEGPRGPRFIRFSANVLDITEGESVQFTAVVTDPDGIDDLIGGALIDPITAATYGAFATSAAEGSYSLSLSWAEMHRLAPIDFITDELREFEAEFFDVSGNRASQRITLTLTCDGEGACDGVCTDLTRTSDCGTCDNVCVPGALCTGGTCGCAAGSEECGGRCVSISSMSNCRACGNVCRASDEICGAEDCQCAIENYIECNGACTSSSSTSNCRGCGNTCGPTGTCGADGCVCGANERLCGGSCGTFHSTAMCGRGCTTCGANETCDGEVCVAAVEGDVRQTSTGVIQVLHDGVWAGICDDSFDAADGEVICRQLGGEYIRHLSRSGDATFWIDELRCVGTEANVTACARNTWGIEDCAGGENVAVYCTSPAEDLVINEVLANPTGSDATGFLEFVEIYGNPGLSLIGKSLVFYNTAGVEYLRWSLSGSIPASGFFVVGGVDVSRNLARVGPIENTAGSIELIDAFGTIDAVAFGIFGVGTTSRGEGLPAQLPAEGMALRRQPYGNDTDSNADDFVVADPTPGFRADRIILPITGTGSVTVAMPTYARTSETCTARATGGFYYNAIVIENPTDIPELVQIDVTWEFFDGWVTAYNATFNPASAATNCVASNDDVTSGDSSTSRLTGVTIPANSSIVLVFTSYTPGANGDFAYTISRQ